MRGALPLLPGSRWRMNCVTSIAARMRKREEAMQPISWRPPGSWAGDRLTIVVLYDSRWKKSFAMPGAQILKERSAVWMRVVQR